MHEALVKEIIFVCKKRQLDDDDYSTKPCSTEMYEEAIIELSDHNANLTRQLEEPIHLGMFYNEDEGIKAIYILDKDGNETDRVVKAECLLKRIAGYFNRAKKAEAQLEEARKALEGIREVYEKWNHFNHQFESRAVLSDTDSRFIYIFWNAIKSAIKQDNVKDDSFTPQSELADTLIALQEQAALAGKEK
jgi:hypothetical protein